MDNKAIRAAKLTAAGILDKARARTAVTRAGGQIAPSKYLPDVPRQVHAGGGKVAFMQGNHPDVPDVVYHGTNDDFTAFRPEGIHWFTSDKMDAADYKPKRIVEAHLSLKNPADLDAPKIKSVLRKNGFDPENLYDLTQDGDKVKALLSSLGHDGMMVSRPDVDKGVMHYAAFHPTQIKSAIGNQGTFDPNDPDITKAGGGDVEGGNGHIYVVHGGSDFDQIDPSYSGRGEPGNIRPLGNGLYGYVLDHTNPENVKNAIGWATRYSQKYGGGKKALHVFKVPKSSSTVFNGYRELNVEGYPKPIKGLGLEPTEELNAYEAHKATEPPYDEKNSADFWAHERKRRALWDAVNNAADLRMQHLPIGLTEVAIQNPKVATRIGKFNLDTPTSDILDAVKSDMQGGNITKSGGGSVTDTDEFRNWFGNSPTHTDGDPHILYTGTSKDKDFTAFNVGRHGTWFTRDPALASQYAEQNDSQGYKQDGWKLTPINTASRVIPAYVKAENPYTGDLPDEVLRDNYKKAQSDWFDTLRRKGHDAWIPARHNGNLVVVLKEPQQIKSIFNNGKFDPNQKHMNKAGGGEVDGDEDGITAYHSSPHDFDQFDISKLGTGEGNQSYGPGLYFAENPKVSDRGGQYWNQFMNRGKQTPEKQAAFALKVAGWDRDKAADSLQKNFEYHADRAIPGKYAEGPELEEGNRLLAQETQEAIDHVRSGKILGPRTYKVKLNVKPHELIDWDEPLSEQHPNIQAVLGSSHETAGSKLTRVNRNPNYRGDILGKDTATLQELYDHFRSKGIKGIRYNDAGSRHGPSGDGTKNYVMFHHDPVQVVDKYEYGGTVGKEEGGATGSLREKGLWPSAQAIKAGTGSREAHEELVNKIKPVSPYLAPVAPASDQQVHDALTKDKQPKAFAPRALGEGTPVAVRLDIPAYEKKNTWVVSVHHPKTDFTAGEVIGYDSVAHIGNPRFGVHPTGALNIASGKPKATIATVHGNWKKTTPEDAFKLSQTVHNDPQWRQVGMDPERHSYFYDRETQEPVMAADEALHIGPLVYAKNPVYGKKTDFAFSEGGEVDNDQPNNVVNLGFRRTMRNAMSDEPPQHVQDVFNHLGDRFEASRQAYVAAKSDGVFDHLPFGDRYKYKLTPNSTPMEVVGHRMMPVERWGMKEPPKLVYQGHYPVVDMEPVGNPADTRHMPVELLADKDRYEFVSGKPRLVKRKGGAVAGALALTRRFTKDGTGATMALKPKGK